MEIKIFVTKQTKQQKTRKKRARRKKCIKYEIETSSTYLCKAHNPHELYFFDHKKKLAVSG